MSFLDALAAATLLTFLTWTSCIAIIILSPFGFFHLLKKINAIDSKIDLALSELNKIIDATKPILASRVVFYAVINGKKEKVTNMFLKVGEKLELAVKFLDVNENQAKVDGIPQWAITGAELGTLTVADDGMSAVFLPGTMLGACKIQCKADADLSEGAKEIIGEMDVEIVAGEAVKVALNATVVPA